MRSGGPLQGGCECGWQAKGDAMLFDELIVWYLFLGGVGSGTYFMGTLMMALLRRARFRNLQVSALVERRMAMPMLLTSLLCSLAGTACLLGDFPSLDHAHLLLFRPTFSAISVGALTLSAFIGCVAFLAWNQGKGVAPGSRAVKIAAAVRWVSLALSLVVMVYTGVLLCLMPSVPLWNTPLLPVLFALSSCATGLGAVLLIGAVVFWDAHRLAVPVSLALRADSAIAAAELFVVIAMGVALAFSSGEAATASLYELVSGTYAPMFWAGFVGVGLVAPPVLGLVFSLVPPKSLVPYAIIGVCILVGGLSLRYCVIGAGVHLSAFMFAGL